jgi:hypothetical protein
MRPFGPGKCFKAIRISSGKLRAPSLFLIWEQVLAIVLYLPSDIEAQIGRFVEHYNHRRYHESLKNLTPADVYFGRDQTILLQRERIKRDTIRKRRLQHQSKAA